jgi:endonuclease YncB( thermonuclease family)
MRTVTATHDDEMLTLEDQAREVHRGLWSDPEALAPLEWRKSGKR